MSERRKCPESENGQRGFIHLHVFDKHVPAAVSYFFILFLLVLMGFALSVNIVGTRLPVDSFDSNKDDLIYGSWPALEDENFFASTRDKFIEDKVTFLEANLSSMTMRYYEKGEVVKEVPIATKGREGSWWETPAGLYQISTKEKNHFSSFGRVDMPNSMQFQGNFFIHGPTFYPDGTPTPSSYSGGCIRLSMDDSKAIFDLVEQGTPLLVFEDSFNGDGKSLPLRIRSFLQMMSLILR